MTDAATYEHFADDPFKDVEFLFHGTARECLLAGWDKVRGVTEAEIAASTCYCTDEDGNEVMALSFAEEVSVCESNGMTAVADTIGRRVHWWANNAKFGELAELAMLLGHELGHIALALPSSPFECPDAREEYVADLYGYAARRVMRELVEK